MPPVEPELLHVLQALHRNNVRFVVVGGIAMRLHGSAHITDDVDVSYARDRDNLVQLTEALRQHRARLRGVPEDLPFILDVQTFRNTHNLTLLTDIGAVDLLGEPAGVESFDGLWARSVVMDVGGFEVHVASLDDLIAMKTAANRPKDQLHLLEIAALKRLLAEAPADGNEQ